MATKKTDTQWERDIQRMSEILEQTAGMQRSEIEAIVSILNLKKDNNQLDKTVLEGILRDKSLSDESMKKTEAAIMAHYNSTKVGGKRRRKTKRKTKRKKRRKTKRKRRRKTKHKRRRKRRTREMRGGG